MLLAILLPTTANGEESAQDEHHSAHDSYKHAVAGFIGGADEGRDEGLALAFEYEYRLNSAFGIGGVVEHTFGNLDTWVYAVPFAYHTGRWRLYAAPGIEDTNHGSESLLRLGVEFAFPRGNWVILPQFDVDLVDGHEIFVLGVSFARLL